MGIIGAGSLKAWEAERLKKGTEKSVSSRASFQLKTEDVSDEQSAKIKMLDYVDCPVLPYGWNWIKGSESESDFSASIASFVLSKFSGARLGTLAFLSEGAHSGNA